MKIEKTEQEFKRLCGLYHINDIGLAAALDLEFLEEPEPSLEERHPRPWKWDGMVFYDGNRDHLRFDKLVAEAICASHNREPLLLEIAEVARPIVSWWNEGAPIRGMAPEFDRLENLLHRLRLEQREEKS